MRIILLIFVLTCAAYGQTITGTVVGVVADDSGAAILDAGVTLTQTNTGAVRRTKTLSSGEFVFSALDEAGYTDWVSLEYHPLEDTNSSLRWLKDLGYWPVATT